MGYDYNKCKTKLESAGMVPVCDQLPGAPYHCDDLVNFNKPMHDYCAGLYDPKNPESEKYIYAPVQTTACVQMVGGKIVAYKYYPVNQVLKECMKLASTDPTWELAYCYCCCGCFAWGTMVATPDGYVMIQDIPEGAEVMSGTPVTEGGATRVEWTPSRVSFSQGVAGGNNPAMIYLSFGDDMRTGDLICSPDQPFMLADGTMVTAEHLAPGESLMSRDGSPVALHTIAMGSYVGGVHHIATGARWNGSVDGHLIDAGGVVAGDFALQLNFAGVDAALKSPGLESRPALGTPQYDEVHGGLKAQSILHFAAQPSNELEEEGEERETRLATTGGLFDVYSTSHRDIYRRSAKFLTTQQARELAVKAVQIPLSNPIPKSAVANLFRIFKGFYPNIDFYLDWYHAEPNVYAFELFGRKQVVVTGGLARIQGFAYEGIAMAIADAVARFSDAQPRGRHAMAGTGAADWYAFAVISRGIWYGNGWLAPVVKAFQQIETLFGFITKHAGGNPHDPVNRPSLECRLEAMQSAVGGGDVPECAGGPPVPKIELEQATASAGEVTVLLSVAATRDTSSEVANYVLEPAVPITSATPDPRTDTIVVLSAAVEPGATYKLTIRNLVSILGSGVDPDADSAEFTAA